MQHDFFAVEPFPGIQFWDTLPEDLPHRMRICIATEEIIGPVRNGGIASTYYHLALGLASRGHDVHVLYLKGPVVENKTPEHWVDHFAELGVSLHYLELPATPTWGAAPVWQKRYAAAYRWLREQEPFGIVHTSEWRGGLIYALMAKAMGVAFDETLFVVKTSSPHIWNRHYQMLPIEKADLITASFAEQKCVELADVVVGGSSHLLRFMEHIGYRLPEGRTYCQPNIVDFNEVPVTDLRPPRSAGEVIQSDEVTFFGRLEARKGIELFCNALDILVSRGTIPKKVNFLGKFGDALANRGGISVSDYLNQRIARWPFDVELITDLNQPEALSFLSSRDMLVTMPSLIENSTMAVYEALECRLPFFATAVGGTPELIAEQDHDSALIQPKSGALADRLEDALKHGLRIPHPSFSNDENLQTWFDFHAYVAKVQFDGNYVELPSQGKKRKPDGDAVLIFHVRAEDGLFNLANTLPDEFTAVRLVSGSADLEPAMARTVEVLRGKGINASYDIRIGLTAGEALNWAINDSTEEYLILSDDTSVVPRPGYADAMRASLTNQPDSLFTCFLTDETGLIFMPIGGDVASQIATNLAYGAEFVAVTRKFLDQIGLLEPYDVAAGLIHELITRAIEKHGSELLVLAEPLADWPQGQGDWTAKSSSANYGYFKAKALVDDTPLSLRKVMLATLSGKRGGREIDPKRFRERKRPAKQPVWLVAADRDRSDVDGVRNAKVVIGLDEANSQLLLLARGSGERVVTVNNDVTEIEELAAGGTPASPVTLDAFSIPEYWPSRGSYAIKLTLKEADGQSRTRFIRINKMAPDVFAAISGAQILNASAIRELYELHTTRRPQRSSKSSTNKRPQAESALKNLPEPDYSAIAELLGNDIVDLLETDAKDKAPTAGHPDQAAVLERVTSIRQEDRENDRPNLRSGMLKQSNSEFASGVIRGWAWDKDDRGKSLTVVALCDGVPLNLTRADAHIQSLKNRTPGLEKHGFSFRFEGGVLPEASIIELSIAETGSLIRGARFRVTAGHLVNLSNAGPTDQPQQLVQPKSSGPGYLKMAIGGAALLAKKSLRLLRKPGAADHRDPQVRAEFDKFFYATQAPEVVASGTDPFKHYCKIGWKQGLDPRPDFSTNEYLRLNSDVADANQNPFIHYILYGKAEGRTAPASDRKIEDRMIETPGNIATVPSHPALPTDHLPAPHYPPEMQRLLLAARNRPKQISQAKSGEIDKYLDHDFYVMRYGDIRANSEIDPAWHFATYGAAEGRSPSPDFATTAYFARYPKQWKHAADAYLHWVKTGKDQGEVGEGPKNFIDASVLSGQPPAEIAARVAERRRDIRHRLHYGTLGEMVKKATDLDPLIAGTWPESFAIKIPPFSNENRNDLMIAVDAMQQSLGLRRARIVICLNNTRWGGGRRMEGHISHALLEWMSADDIVIITTEDGGDPPASRYPDGVRVIDASGVLKTLGKDQRERALMEVLRSLKPDAILNINSRHLWETMDTYGHALSEKSRLIACLFCIDQNEFGVATGYAPKMLARHSDYVDAVFTDSISLREELSSRFHMVSSRMEIATLPAPASTEIDPVSEPQNARPQVFWAGRFDQQKRPEIVIALARQMPHVDFHMWGETVLAGRIADTSTQPPNLTLHPAYQAFSDLPIENADLWLYTSAWDGVPAILLEVAMTGVPIAGSLVGGTSEIIGHGLSYPVDPEDGIDGYQHAIDAVLDDPNAARRNALALREKLLQERTTETFKSSLADLLGLVHSPSEGRK